MRAVPPDLSTDPAGFPRLSAIPSPAVIAHRGASGYRPEHTLASYALAVAMGADFIEPDLTATKDGRLVARHEPEIGATTDVAGKFPERFTRREIDGAPVEGWFVSDFTLAELKTLRARQPAAGRADAWDGLFDIPTFEEILELATTETRRSGRPIGVYPETKHPTYHRSLGLPLEPALLAALDRFGLNRPDAAVLIQSFETANLRELATLTPLPLIQLLDEPHLRPQDFVVAGDPRTYADMARPEGLREIAGYAWGIGPWKRMIVPEEPDGVLGPPTRLIEDAHAAGLRVHAYTFRDEPHRLAAEYRLDPTAEYRRFFRLGVDGVFSDFPDTARRARDEEARRRNPPSA